MCAFPVIYNEEVRLSAIAGSCFSQTIDDPRLDRLTRLAAYITSCPAAMITTVTTVLGLNSVHGTLKDVLPREIPRELSICNYTILEKDMFVVEDMTLDPRFRDKPFVANFPHLRFYTGVPLTDAMGHRSGSLCVIDHVPRHLENAQILALRDLGAIANDVMRAMQAEFARPGAPAKLP